MRQCVTLRDPAVHSLWRSGPGGSGWRGRSWRPETGVGADALLSAGLATPCHISGTKAPCADEVLSGHPRMIEEHSPDAGGVGETSQH